MSALLRKASPQGTRNNLMASSPQPPRAKQAGRTLLDSNGSRFILNADAPERRSTESGSKPFYRRPMPVEPIKKHIVTTKQAGLMVDDDGEIVDCFGRYSSMALQGKGSLLASLQRPSQSQAMVNVLAKQKQMANAFPEKTHSAERKYEAQV